MAHDRYHLTERYPPRDRGDTHDLFATDVSARVFHAPAEEIAEVIDTVGHAPKLIYLDPPFSTNRRFTLRWSVEQDGERFHREETAYDDRWEGGLDGYLAWMGGILPLVRDALADDGSMLLHCDQRAAPYLAVMCDEYFGRGARVDRAAPGFRAELIWHYGLGGSSPRSYPRKHDTILWYSKSETWQFVAPMVPATSQRMKGKLKKMPDVFEIPSLNNMARERCGYPTQKPLELLDMLIRAHTNPGDWVFDPFSGSGTTAVAATNAGRNAVAADASEAAIAFIRERLFTEAQGAEIRILRRGTSWVDPPSSASPRWRSYRGELDSDEVFVGSQEGTATLVRTLEGSEYIER